MMEAVTISGVGITEPVGVTELATSVEGFDPLTWNMTWKNNTLATDTPVVELMLPGIIVGNEVSVISITFDGTVYIWCFAGVGHAQSPGQTVTSVARTYAVNLPESMTLDMYTAIMKYTTISEADKAYVDGSSGRRLMGIKDTTVTNIMKLPVYAQRVFNDVMTISPSAPSGPAAEITGLSVIRA